MSTSSFYPLVPLTRAALKELCPTRPGETRLGQAVQVLDEERDFPSLVDALRSKAASGYDQIMMYTACQLQGRISHLVNSRLFPAGLRKIKLLGLVNLSRGPFWPGKITI